MMQSTWQGSIEVICGSMFSGKTEELLRRLRRAQFAKQKIQVFKPALDTRFSSSNLRSHDAAELPSIPVAKASEILERVDNNTRVVGIDEVQFFDEGILYVAQKLAFSGKRVIIAGLDMDFRGEPFGPMPFLLAVAESVTKLNAVCVVCGHPASRSQRVAATEGDSQEQILIGATETYEPRCRFCHEPHTLKVTAK